MSLRYATGCFAKSPLQVVVALLNHPPVVELAATALDLGHHAGVAAEVLRAGEPIDRAHFPIDHNREDLRRTRHRLDQLYSPRDPHPFQATRFEPPDLRLNQFKQLEPLLPAAAA